MGDAICVAARNLAFGSAGHVPDSYRARAHKGGYATDEVADAINRCKHAIEATPTERQFNLLPPG